MERVRTPLVPLSSFALAVLLAIAAGPARRALSFRSPTDPTGPCKASHDIEKMTLQALAFTFTITDMALFHVTSDASSNLEYTVPFITYHAKLRVQKNNTAHTHTETKSFTFADENQAIEMPVAGPLTDAEIELPGSFTFSEDSLANFASSNAMLKPNESLISTFLEGPQSVKMGFTSQFMCYNPDGSLNTNPGDEIHANLTVDADGTSKKPKTVSNK